MIRTHKEVRMSNNALDGNELQNGFLKNVQNELVPNSHIGLTKSLKIWKMLFQCKIPPGNFFLSFS